MIKLKAELQREFKYFTKPDDGHYYREAVVLRVGEFRGGRIKVTLSDLEGMVEKFNSNDPPHLILDHSDSCDLLASPDVLQSERTHRVSLACCDLLASPDVLQ